MTNFSLASHHDKVDLVSVSKSGLVPKKGYILQRFVSANDCFAVGTLSHLLLFFISLISSLKSCIVPNMESMLK